MPATNIAKDHPLETNSAIFPTPALRKCNNVIRSWSDNYVPGGMIIGTQRVGKTFAVKHFTKFSQKVYGIDTPTYLHCCQNENSGELPFLQSLLMSTKYDMDLPSSLGRARARLIDHLECQAINSGENRITLITDDAQWLKKRDFHRLMWAHNSLDDRGIYLLVVLVGQPELKAHATNFINSPEIMARFMNERVIVKGIQRVTEIRSILDAIDTKAEYPVGSGMSFTWAYVPLAFKSGFRLSSYANDIFNAFNQVSIEVRGKRINQLTMQTFCRFSRDLLRQLSKRDYTALELTEDLITASIQRSGFRSLEILSKTDRF